MDKSSITLLLGITFGLAVVGVVAVFIMMAKSNTPVLSASLPMQYNNEEKWDIVKDADGRVKTVVVHREAKQG